MLFADYGDDNGDDDVDEGGRGDDDNDNDDDGGRGDDANDNGGDGGGDDDHNGDFDYGDGDTSPLAVQRPPVLSSDIDHDMMARKHC